MQPVAMLREHSMRMHGSRTARLAQAPLPSVRPHRRCMVLRAVADSSNPNGGVKPAAPSMGQAKSEDLDERIMSGEFTDQGSTKEKLTRPIRKALAKDPVGIGE